MPSVEFPGERKVISAAVSTKSPQVSEAVKIRITQIPVGLPEFQWSSGLQVGGEKSTIMANFVLLGLKAGALVSSCYYII